jgi:class 3 adenylate cyclase
MGDGLLAIFPCGDGPPTATCEAALRAAQAIGEGVAGADPLDETPLGYGLALHLGEVLYGNIGAGHRLDFTAIGPAVNKAARLEKLTAELGLSLVTSADFAAAIGQALVPIGPHPLKGFAEPELVHGLARPATA